jgi:hypothetical protein
MKLLATISYAITLVPLVLASAEDSMSWNSFSDRDESGVLSPDDEPKQCNGQWYEPRLVSCPALIY